MKAAVMAKPGKIAEKPLRLADLARPEPSGLALLRWRARRRDGRTEAECQYFGERRQSRLC